MSRRRRFWLGLFVLLLTPFLVLTAFALYVYMSNSQPQSGELQTKVSPQVVLPWEEAVYYIEYAGFKPPPTPTPAPPPPPPPPPSPDSTPSPAPSPTPVPSPSPIDVVFIVDESGSMIDSIAAMASAAQSVVEDLAKDRPGRFRYAAIRFNEAAEIQVDWTEKPQELVDGLNAIAQNPREGGTDGRVAFRKLEELLATARPKAEKVVIFYTDGVIHGPLIYIPEITATALNMRFGQKVQFYSVGIPYQGSDAIMTVITGSSSRVFDPLNHTELARMFRKIEIQLSPPTLAPAPSPTPTPKGRSLKPTPVVQPTPPPPLPSSGQLSHRVDGRHFATPLDGTNWVPGGDALNLPIRPVPDDTITYAHPLVPLSAGLWHVGVEPPQLVFFDEAGDRHQVLAQRRPLLLRITYLTLLLMALPGLAWTAAHLWPRRSRVTSKSEVVEPQPRPLPVLVDQTYPEPLPLLPRLSVQRLSPVPTVFVGLGGAGRRALHAIRADLKQAHLGAAGQPYSFLWIDTDTQEAERQLSFEEWRDYDIQTAIAPPSVRQLARYLPEPGRIQEHLQWFNPYLYRDASSPQLNLADGAKGERALARLALFQWLSQTNGLLPVLVEHVKQLAEFPAEDGTRQIVIIGAADGGAGGGWFLDVARLFQRIAREQEKLEALPDVIGVLCQERDRRHPENERALSLELETAQAARKFPQRVTFVPDDKLLDQTDTQSPYHWVFSVNAGDKNSLAAQCGELISVMVERQPRARLLDQAQTVSAPVVVATSGYSTHVLPTVIFDQVKCELFLSILGPDILLDVVPDVQGGLKPQPVSSDRAGDLLHDWSQLEQSGSPLQLLLAAALDQAMLPAFLSSVTPPSNELPDWFSKAFAQSLTQRLQGHAVGEGAWERDCKPAEAVAMLRLLSSQLTHSVKPQLAARNAPAQVIEIVDQVIGLADTAADDLARWLADFCNECEQVAAKRDQLEESRRSLLRLEGRSYLDLEVEPSQIKRWAQDGLQIWLGTPDTVSAIRKRLFFAIVAGGANARASVMSYIAEDAHCYATAGEVATAIDQLSNSLALHVPTVRISGVLAHMSNERRRDLANGLVPVETRPEQVLLVLPEFVGLGTDEQQALDQFEGAIPKLPAHGPRTTQRGNDHSAVRRMELASAVSDQGDSKSKLTFVEMSESMAEAVRSRAESKYRITLPIFPPRLRIALAHTRAFRSFARAYKAGHIRLAADGNGRQQWNIDGQFLTFETESSLAHAAANYVRDFTAYPESFANKKEKGSFAELEKWLDDRGAPDANTLTQIAIDVYEQ
ncbi:MAG TPA: tubulin-like doman-containing protein [Pyrinomonadaceae bacterium]|nr:tubulin-like doman-containing protein [Pyrinomonadaceae bacterium]